MRHYDLPVSAAVRVLHLEENGPAATAGVRLGDAVVSFAGEPVDSLDALLRLLTEDRVGVPQPLVLEVRGVERLEVLRSRPVPRRPAEAGRETGRNTGVPPNGGRRVSRRAGTVQTDIRVNPSPAFSGAAP